MHGFASSLHESQFHAEATVSIHAPSHQPDSDQKRMTQGVPPHGAWQVARRKIWWRREREKVACHRPANLTQGQKIFKSKIAGRCYNCLAFDHRVAQCHDPTRCWKCRGFDHISSRCRSKNLPPSKLQSLSTTPATTLLPSVADTHPASLHPPPQKVIMERWRSFGNGALPMSHSTFDLLVEDRLEYQGSAINFLGNPRFRPRVAFKMLPTFVNMEDR
jgi:hypothetical protein